MRRSDGPEPGGPGVVGVGELTRAIAGMLGEAFPRISVRGQISNARLQRSGHLYFSLKDEDAQLNCAMWRSSVGRLRFRPEDGQEVVATGRVEVYPPHGKYQLIVQGLEPLGVGELHRRYEELKRRLAEEGLFDESRKRELPALPRRVALVTSPTSAAVRDLLRVAYRRSPRAWITVFPVRVQGAEAPGEIVNAVASAQRVGAFDVIVLARGGGSMEDLWAFNDEAVVRAIVESPVPVVTGVGHETDFTISDFASDARAATPSEAAELVFPETAELEARLREYRQRLESAITRRAERARERLEALARTHALARPLERMHQARQRLDELEERGLAALAGTVGRSRERLARLSGHLHAVSPLAVLERGYSITTRDGERSPLTSAAELEPGARLTTRLADGEVLSEVLEARPAPEAQR